MTTTFETLTDEYNAAEFALAEARLLRYSVSVQTDDLTKNIASTERATLAAVAEDWQNDGKKSNEDQRRAETEYRLANTESYVSMLGNLRQSQKQQAELEIEIDGRRLDVRLLDLRMQYAIATEAG